MLSRGSAGSLAAGAARRRQGGATVETTLGCAQLELTNRR